MATVTGMDLLGQGLTRRNLSYWVDAGFIQPVQRGGTGRPLEFSPLEAQIALVMSALAAEGVGAAKAAKLARSGPAGAETLRRLADLVEAVPLPEVAHAQG